MKIEKKEISATGIKLFAMDGGKEVARAFLYLLKNELHDQPFGFLEDVYIDEAQRGQGLGSQLMAAVIEEAKQQGCYKLIGNSRHSRENVHRFYEKLGFENYGIEFRMNL
jgi:GNAT superfamily N-acetyltransferase